MMRVGCRWRCVEEMSAELVIATLEGGLERDESSGSTGTLAFTALATLENHCKPCIRAHRSRCEEYRALELPRLRLIL